MAVVYGLYDATRGMRHAAVATANHNGQLVLRAEHDLHATPEHWLNDLLWHAPGLAVPSAYYYATLHFIATPLVLVWLYRQHPSVYLGARRVLVTATVASLVAFWVFPVTPPRLLPGSTIHDTLADVHQWGWWAGPTSAPRGLGMLANEYAAMPSLHVAWALWAGVMIARHATRRWVRALGVMYPLLTALVVMATGNHYLLDVLVGTAVLIAAFLAVPHLTQPREPRTGGGPRADLTPDPLRTAGSVAVNGGHLERANAPAVTAVRSTRPRLRRLVLGVAVVGLLVTEIVAISPYLRRTGASIHDLNLWWLAAAIVVELGSMQAFALMQHRMFRSAGGRTTARRIVAMTYSANAVSMTLPAGSALASAYTYRRLRSWGAGIPAASFTLISSGVLNTTSFALIGVSAALLFGASSANPTLVIAPILAVVALIAILRLLNRRPNVAAHFGSRLMAWASRMHQPSIQTRLAGIGQFIGELSAIRPRPRHWALGLGLATTSWVADLVCLVACANAVGLRGATLAVIVIAYLAGMGVSSLSFTPAGLGIVDAAMVLTLVRGGVALPTAAAAVLVYRLVSVAFVVAIGWAVWIQMRMHAADGGFTNRHMRERLSAHDHDRQTATVPQDIAA